MPQASRASILRELGDLTLPGDDPALDALQIAMYLEDALGTTIPTEALTEDLISSDARSRLLDYLTGEA